MKQQVVDENPKRICSIDYSAFSAQETKRLSVIELHERDLYDISNSDRPPKPYGALDRRLGIADKSVVCETCNNPLANCVGHFGVIRLSLPVFHIGYFKLTLTILQCICKRCSKIPLEGNARRSFLRRVRNPNLDWNQKKDVLKQITTLCKKMTRCAHCGYLNGPVKKVGALKIIHERFRKKGKYEDEDEFFDSFKNAVDMDPSMNYYVSRAQEDISPLQARRLLSAIRREDWELLGLNPEKQSPDVFMWSALPVPPVCIRPSIGQENTSTEDDLTVLLSEIIEVNAKIKGLCESGQKTESLQEYWDYLQLQCAMYITSDLPGIPSHLQGNLPKIKKGFCQRLKGKHGRFRGNLSGKRVDFSARTVISPDPNLKITQVAVPERVAKMLTYPERVTQHNINRLRQNVINGIDTHPGAVYVEKANGIKCFLRYGDRKKLAMNLRIGDVVDRHLHNGDIVLFNRQPSLHKLSIMAHYAVVKPWRTFRFNECVCTPYNADFDGDEMNLHLPQTEEARAEAAELMGIKYNLVTPRNGEPLIAATQDFITTSYLLSKKNVFYDRSQFVQICSYLSDNTSASRIVLPPPSIMKPMQLWTGKQVFTVLLNPYNEGSRRLVNLEAKCRTFGKEEKDKNGVKFMNQTTYTGQKLDNTFCPNDGWLLIYNGELLAGVVDKAIVGDGNKKSMFYAMLCDYGADAAAECMNRVAKLSARWLTNQGFSIGINDVQPSMRLSTLKEEVVKTGYANCDKTIELSRSGKLPNQAGCNQEQTLESKLSGILSKIRDDVGQVCFEELSPYNAPLIMSLCGSKGSKINVSQMVACVGQQIISGSRIPNGFIDRSLPHFARNSKIPAAKGFVRNSFYSGLQPYEFFFHAVSGREGLVDTAVKTAETGYMQRRLMKALEDLTCQYDQSVRNSTGNIVQFRYGDDGLDPAKSEGADGPVDFARNFLTAQAREPSHSSKGLTVDQVSKYIDKTLSQSNFKKNFSDSFCEDLKKFIIKDAVALIGDHFDDEGKLKRNYKTKITKQQLDEFLSIIYKKYMHASSEPGTAVGAVGAQSIGEPGTQMTLKTFHFAGVASMNVTLGVPRIKEIINASKKINTPIIDATLVSAAGTYKAPDNATSEQVRQARLSAEAAARVVKARIEKTILQDVTSSMEEVVGPDTCFIRVNIDIETMKKLQLESDLEVIRSSIVKTSALKLSDKYVRLDGRSSIRVLIGEENTFRNMQVLKRALPKVIIKGLPQVRRAVINDNEKEDRLNILVEGYGLREVIATEGVDGLRTKTNHTLETLSTLGIEAARKNIIDEIQYTMQSHGMTIDSRHVMLLADLMCFKGEVLGITRFGISKMSNSVLMLASFEKTTDHLFDAAFYGRKDKIAGVSECIIMGLPVKLGTGLFKLLQKTDRPEDIIPPSKQVAFESIFANLP